MTNKMLWDRAVRECRRWGVNVEVDDSEHGIAKFSSPINDLGIVSKHLIVHKLNTSVQEASSSALIHELAHVIDWRLTEFTPNYASEDDVMLAIEHEANRRLRLPWLLWMENWGTPDGRVWPELSPRGRAILLAGSYELAQEAGLLTKKGKPTYTRS